MRDAFNSVYASCYDDLYHDKDYAAECDLIERIIHTYGNGCVRSVLDLGCGTGSHSVVLAQRGYEVVGVDCSDSMLGHAQGKSATSQGKGKAVFQHGDICNVDLQRHFDAALMMFAVLSYQLENADVLSALRTARRHLRQHGLLVFDIWYGPAVLHLRPSSRVKRIPIPTGQIVRVASAELDIHRHICTVHYHLRRFEEERLVTETQESHLIRYFFPEELEAFLESSGFAPERLGAFPEFNGEPDKTTWNVLVVARAI